MAFALRCYVKNAMNLLACFTEQRSKAILFVMIVKKSMKMCDYYIEETNMCEVLIELCPFHNYYRRQVPPIEMCRYANENLTKKTDVIKW